MSNDGLGDRIKRYERSWAPVLPPNSWVLVRVDGRAFHTWTRFADRPFDGRVHSAMIEASLSLASDIGGFRLAYTQSDEATFLFTDTAAFESQLWFGGEVSKIVSITAAGFTAHFNRAIHHMGITTVDPAMFDSRVFTMPAEDAANAFVWRQRDWERNSLQMLARVHFSQRELDGKDRIDMGEMLRGVGVDWDALDPVWRHGTFVYPRSATDEPPLAASLLTSNDKHDWASINAMAGIEAT